MTSTTTTTSYPKSTSLCILDPDLIGQIFDRIVTDDFKHRPSLPAFAFVCRLASLCHTTELALRHYTAAFKGSIVKAPIPLGSPFLLGYEETHQDLALSCFQLTGGETVLASKQKCTLLNTLYTDTSRASMHAIAYRVATYLDQVVASSGITYVREGIEKPRAVMWCRFDAGDELEALVGIDLGHHQDRLIGVELDLWEATRTCSLRDMRYQLFPIPEQLHAITQGGKKWRASTTYRPVLDGGGAELASNPLSRKMHVVTNSDGRSRLLGNVTFSCGQTTCVEDGLLRSYFTTGISSSLTVSKMTKRIHYDDALEMGIDVPEKLKSKPFLLAQTLLIHGMEFANDVCVSSCEVHACSSGGVVEVDVSSLSVMSGYTTCDSMLTFLTDEGETKSRIATFDYVNAKMPKGLRIRGQPDTIGKVDELRSFYQSYNTQTSTPTAIVTVSTASSRQSTRAASAEAKVNVKRDVLSDVHTCPEGRINRAFAPEGREVVNSVEAEDGLHDDRYLSDDDSQKDFLSSDGSNFSDASVDETAREHFGDEEEEEEEEEEASDGSTDSE